MFDSSLAVLIAIWIVITIALLTLLSIYFSCRKISITYQDALYSVILQDDDGNLTSLNFRCESNSPIVDEAEIIWAIRCWGLLTAAKVKAVVRNRDNKLIYEKTLPFKP